MTIELDKETKAIIDIINALGSLEDNEKLRVLKYVGERTGVGLNLNPSAFTHIVDEKKENIENGAFVDRLLDIRSLKNEKKPKDGIQMAALVAYYLQECAPEDMRKKHITDDDVDKYFKQAGFPLPKKARFTLVNARNAGYFESVGKGQYKLNPVGYNLVAHNLPATNEAVISKKRQKIKREGNKRKKK